MTVATTAFDQNTKEYDQWFEKHSAVYQSEILVFSFHQRIDSTLGTIKFSKISILADIDKFERN